MRTFTRTLSASIATFALILGALVVLVGTASTSTAVPAVDKDCGDFPNQAAAQRYFLAHGGPRFDPSGLDAEHDGVACESNPCPCYYGTSGGGGGGTPATPPKPARPVERDTVRVVKVVDGDTIKVRFPSGRRANVRIIGIDTPEVYGRTQCGGEEASHSAENLLPEDSKVVITSDPTQAYKDRYGRLLRYMQKGDMDFGKRQLFRGWAKVYVYGGKPFQRTKGYRAAESSAKRDHRGKWSLC